VWGGFTETERLRLQMMGWKDCEESHRVDVPRLEQRLARGIPSQRH